MDRRGSSELFTECMKGSDKTISWTTEDNDYGEALPGYGGDRSARNRSETGPSTQVSPFPTETRFHAVNIIPETTEIQY